MHTSLSTTDVFRIVLYKQPGQSTILVIHTKEQITNSFDNILGSDGAMRWLENER